MAKKIIAQEHCMFCAKHPCECPKPDKKKEVDPGGK